MNKMKKRKLFISLAVLTCLCFGMYKYYSRTSAPTNSAVWVKVSDVKEATLPLEAHAIGTLVASSVEITPEVAGHVEKIYFKDGSFVRKGELLLQLNDEVPKAQYQSANARLAYSENDYNRKVLLGKRGAIAQQAIDQADADLKEKKALAQEKAVFMNKMKLLAPFDGMVGKANVSVGEYVKMGQQVVTVTDTKHLRIEYNVQEKFLPLLKRGQEVKLTSSAYPDRIFYGKVSYISPTINTDNRSVSLYAEVNNEDNLLAPGMFVNAIQSLGSESKALMIPSRSLVPMLDGEQVFKVVDGKAYAVSILIGKRTNDEVQILQGLKVGEKIITDGQLKVKNGMAVQTKT